MKVYLLVLLIAFGLKAHAQNYEQGLSINKKRELCYELLVSEFNTVLSKDTSFLQAKLTQIGIKLAESIIKRKGEVPENLKTYAKLLVSQELLTRLEKDPQVMDKVIALYASRGDKKTVYSPKLEVYADLQEIISSNRLSDSQASTFLAHLAATDKDFGQEEVALAWFVNRASVNFDGKESHYIEGIVQAALQAKGSKRERLISKNLAKARLKISAGLARIKQQVFENNRSYCLSDYKVPLNAQHRSIFQGCREEEEEIVSSAFLKSMGLLLERPEMTGLEVNIGLLPGEKRRLASDQIRAAQDELNSEKYSSKERVIEFYKRGIYPDDGACQTFTIVDKKSGETSVFSVDGEEIFSAPSIKARPREGKDQVVFNPDSELRKFENGSYTRASSAGVFYTILDMPKKERKRRLYDDEFDDRVFVISPRAHTESGYVYDDSTIIALHGVPINGWVQNANERLSSFEGNNRALSTGCINLEAYAYDLMNDLSQNHCPVYIVPEDDKNYFHIKNREVKFSTYVQERKQGREPAKRCQGKVRVVSGEAICDGKWKTDKKNINKYYFDQLSKEIYHQDIIVDGNESVARLLFDSEDRLIRKVVAGNIDAEDFEDLVALTHGLSPSIKDAESAFKDLYNAYYELKQDRLINFDLMPVHKKRKLIIEYYLDPEGLSKSRISKGKSLYFRPPNKAMTKSILEKSKQVRFVHEDS